MQNSHKRVKHLWWYILVNMIILSKIHPLALQRLTQFLESIDFGWTKIKGTSMWKYAFQELLYFFLIANSIVIAEVPAFFVMVESFSLSLTISDWGRAAIYLDLFLGCMQLYVSLKRHVRYHYTNVFRSDVVVVVEVVPEKSWIIWKGVNGTYMSNVNFILMSRSPMKIFVKFSIKDYSVTYSFACAAFGFFKLIGVFFGRPGEFSCYDCGVPLRPAGLLAEDGSDPLFAELWLSFYCAENM